MARRAPPQSRLEEAVGLEPTRELPQAVFGTAAGRPNLGLRFQVPAMGCRPPRALHLRHHLTDSAGIRRRSGERTTRTSRPEPRTR